MPSLEQGDRWVLCISGWASRRCMIGGGPLKSTAHATVSNHVDKGSSGVLVRFSLEAQRCRTAVDSVPLSLGMALLRGQW